MSRNEEGSSLLGQMEMDEIGGRVDFHVCVCVCVYGKFRLLCESRLAERGNAKQKLVVAEIDFPHPPPPSPITQRNS